jgi:hypothetical protein
MPACAGGDKPPATLEFHARSTVDVSRLGERVAIAIPGCGGRILELDEPREGLLCVLWEFECERAMEVYGVLVALGIQLSRSAHLSMTRVWQCARHGHCLRRLPVMRVRMTVEAGLPIGEARETTSSAG